MKTIKINLLVLAITAFSLTTIFSCTDVEDPPNPNEEELITTVELSFTDTTQGSTVTIFRFSDPDGEGGNAPTETDTIRLSPNTVYNMSVRFLDESTSNVDDITAEVEEESAEHLVCYTSETGTTVTITDMDANSLPIGLTTQVATTSAESGLFSVVLKHQPDVKNGNCDVGDTDVEIDFVFEVM